MREKGLYKKISENELLYAKEAIYYPTGEIIKVSDFENTNKEYDDWKWFASEEDANQYYKIIYQPIIER